MAIVREPTVRRRMGWLRLALLITACLLMAGGGYAWWLHQPSPLTVEERPFVGLWALPSPIRTASLAVDTVAYEFRPDRKVIYHRHDSRTGLRSTADTGITWRVGEGRFIYRSRDPRPFISSLLNSGSLAGFVKAKPLEIEMDVNWDGPDRCEMATAYHSAAGPSTQELTRVRAEDP